MAGQWGRWFDSDPRPIATSSEGSIESLLEEAGRSQTFLDLRNNSQDGTWLRERSLAKPFGYLELEASWNEVTDGFFYINTISKVNSTN